MQNWECALYKLVLCESTHAHAQLHPKVLVYCSSNWGMNTIYVYVSLFTCVSSGVRYIEIQYRTGMKTSATNEVQHVRKRQKIKR